LVPKATNSTAFYTETLRVYGCNLRDQYKHNIGLWPPLCCLPPPHITVCTSLNRIFIGNPSA